MIVEIGYVGALGAGPFVESQRFDRVQSVGVEYDEIGIWSEVKLAIIKEYASAYAKILDKM